LDYHVRQSHSKRSARESQSIDLRASTKVGKAFGPLLTKASGAHRLSGKIDPQHLPLDFTYEPELFPAVMCRRAGLHFTCRLSGIMIITGIKGEKDIDEVNAIIIELELLV
jgi:hypothetical protein